MSHSDDDFEVLEMTKDTVEDCLVLNINSLNRDGKGVSALSHGFFGTISWSSGSIIGARTTADLMTDRRELIIDFTKKNVSVNQVIQIIFSSMPHGGRRPWFRCPLTRDGIPCGRRVGRLYLPYYATRFGCRHCYDLTYPSQQEWTSPKFKALFDSFKLMQQLESETRDKKRMSRHERDRLNLKYEKLIELFRKAGIKLYDE